ncbi:MAG: phosphate acyltransferase PlsX [Chlamydiae bacterium]|nr:phosphate acyltransferase PlsX [Chlamydiota bacterium]
MDKTNKDWIENRAVRIGIDLLGSDTPPEKVLQEIIKFSKESSDDSPELTIFATKEVFEKIPCPEKIHTYPVKEWITMEEDPLHAARRKKEASLCIGMKMIRNYELDGFITAGNTAALMACSKLYLSMIPGIQRPALMALIPTKKKPIAVIDVGANLQVSAEQLVQFAKMGIAYQKTRDVVNPVVGLLNIGTEEKKGTQELRQAYAELQKLNRDSPVGRPVFIGNVEGRDAFSGEIDVLVTDGFTGNVFLKTAEGIAEFILEQLESFPMLNCSNDLKNFLSVVQTKLHYAEYPGAVLCGVDGIVLKCHGTLNPKALIHTIKSASRLVKHFFLEKIKKELL